MSELRPASTVLLLRERSGLEVFLVKRHGKSRFMPGAWVFPGGRVDARDAAADARITGGAAVMERLHLSGDEGRGFLVAAVRETFEESGIWLGDGALPQELRDPLNDGELSLAEALQRHEARIDLDVLMPWSWWVTPEVEPRRYDTRFVVAVADQEGSHDARETVDSGWFTPQDALAAVACGEVRMAPPTWWTVTELDRLGSVAAVRRSAAERAIARIQPELVLSDGKVELFLPGHDRHSAPALPGLPTHIALREGRWWAQEDGDERADG